MLQLLIGTNLPFMRYRRFAYLLSGSIAAATAVWLLAHGGPKYSVDFTGGTLLQIRLGRVLSADQVRQALDAGGLKGAELQQMTGENRAEFLIRIQTLGQGQGDLFARTRDAIHAHNPLGISYATEVYSKIAGENLIPLNAAEFLKIVKHPVIAKYRPKIVIGGPGAWQLERAERLDEFNVDYLIDGEIEKVFSDLFGRMMAGDPTLERIIKVPKNMQPTSARKFCRIVFRVDHHTMKSMVAPATAMPRINKT